MQSEHKPDSPDEHPPGEPPADGNPAEHFGHGAKSALTRMKQWERSRAQLNSERGQDKPQAE